MSAGGNVRTVSQTGSGSGIPLPRSAARLDHKHLGSNSSGGGGGGLMSQGKALFQTQHSHSLSSSTSSLPALLSSSPSSREALRGRELKAQLLLQQQQQQLPRGGVGQRSLSTLGEKTKTWGGSRSAYSSPQVSKREIPSMAPVSKDTLDIRRGSLPVDTWRELGRNGNGNLRAGGHPHFRSLDNGPVQEVGPRSLTTSDFLVGGGGGGRVGGGREVIHHRAARPSNGNVLWLGGGSHHRHAGHLQRGGRRGVEVAREGHHHHGGGGLSDKDKELGVIDEDRGSARSVYQNTSVNTAGRESPRMAAVAPFRFRLQVQEDTDGSLEDLSDCSSESMEVCCDDIGGMLGGRGREPGVKTNQKAEGAKTYTPAEAAKGTGTVAAAATAAATADNMAAKRGGKPGIAGGVGGGTSGVPRSELRVYRAGSSDTGRLPVPTNLRKQRSLTNLAVMTDAEKKMQLYEPKWCDDMGKPGAGGSGSGRGGYRGRAAGAGGGVGGGGPGGGGSQLSRNLSKSEHSLFQGKPKPFSALPTPTAPGKGQSRIPRGPYAEVKPLSKASEESGKSDDDLLTAKAKAAEGAKKGAAVAPSDAEGKGQAEEGGGGDRGFLKVDPELVVTVLGDLEQLLFSQMLDPESQRKRTVQNVLDLRQNLEDTMSSLRGTQLSHSCMESSVCYDSDETNARSLSSLSNRSSPLSWRHGQSSPRLQAGDAPSSTGSGGVGGVGGGGIGGGGGGSISGRSQYTSHTMPSRCTSRLSRSSQLELLESLDGDMKSGYLSDSDLLSKSLHDDMDDDDDNLANGWDESSSISSGLSDGSCNLSSEDLNASSSLNSLPTTPTGSHRNTSIMLRTDAEKRSLVESGLAWYSEDAKVAHKLERGGAYDTGSLKAEPTSHRWKKSRPLEGVGGAEKSGSGSGGGGGGGGGGSVGREMRKPQSLGQPGSSFKKGRNPPIGVTSPITHTSQSVLKVAGAPSKPDSKPMDKSKMVIKGTGLQRSCSDAGRDRGEHRKPPSGLVKPSAGGSFGYKKPPPATGTATVLTAGGSTISSGSATVGKTPRSSGIPIKPVGMSGIGGGGVGGLAAGTGGRKNSFDASSCLEQGFMSPNARSSIQYRSLPRPAKSSAMSLTTAGPRPSAASRPPISGTAVDSGGLLALKPMPASPIPGTGSVGRGGKMRSSSTSAAGVGAGGPVNQTDREKEKERAKAKADLLDSVGLKGGLQLDSGSGDRDSSLPKGHSFRRASSSKYPELSSPTTHSVKSLGMVHPPHLAHLDKVNSNSLDSCISIQDLPPKIPPYSKLQDLAGSSSMSPSSSSSSTNAGPSLSPRLTPSPAPLLHIDSPGCFSGASLSLSGTPLLYPRMSGLHRSMEALPMHMSLPPSAELTPLPRQHDDAKATGTWGSASRSSANLSDSHQTASNTLPKKGFSCYDSPGREGKERRHSHNVVSMTESDSPPQLPSPTHITHCYIGKTPPTNIVAPIPSVGGTPRISRSNSIPTNEAAYDLYGSSPLGSSVSLADRPKSMMRSGSFREPGEDVHGSVLSLASNASSNYSSTEERMQGEQIRKLRRELEFSQEKVANLTNQLSENANLVAAFEQSLQLMTSRLQSLSVTSEQKDTELSDLKETIETLKAKNTEASVIIQGALNVPESAPRELRINRQNSSESISSLNSITSHSSAGSLKEQDPKKKKKKSWLRSSFNKAFSKKGSKLSASYADIEEIATPESSAPSSPKLHHDPENPPASLKAPTSISAMASTAAMISAPIMTSASASASASASVSVSPSALSAGTYEEGEGGDGEEKVVSELRSELWEKERKLTDIRLEALSSAHQLEQLRDAMTNMQVTVEKLKAENDQLKTGGPSSRPPSSTSQSSGLGSLGGLSPRQSVVPSSLPKTFSMSLGESGGPDVFASDSLGYLVQKDEGQIRVCVRVPDQQVFKEETKQQNFYIGWVRINARTEWPSLDSSICKIFRDYLSLLDPSSSLGLSSDSIFSYSVGHIRRMMGVEPPETAPHRCLTKSSNSVILTIKGLREKCVDCVVFETLVPKAMMQHYISLLLKHRRIVLSGPSGTGKSYLASRLTEYLVERSGREPSNAIAINFNMHRQSCKDLQLYLSNLANQIDRETSSTEIPLVVILDDVHDAASISELVNGALTCKYHKCPYIIGTTNQPVKMTPNHGLHLSFRMVTFSNNVEPANGFLGRYLHRKLVEAEDPRSLANDNLLRVLDWVPKLWYHLHAFLEKHSTSDFLIGPCFFLSCPVTIDEFRSWFIDLWNHSIIPYLQEGAKDGMKAHGPKAAWEDPVEWVRGSLPWPSAQQDQAKLFHLPPPAMGPGSPGQLGDERPHKETPPSASGAESDPLMAMLLKLQEAANYIESPEREMDHKLPML